MDDTTTPEFNISGLEVAGNVPDDIKLKLRNLPRNFKPLNIFGKAIQFKLKLTEVSVINKAEEPNKLEGRLVYEIDVAEGK